LFVSLAEDLARAKRFSRIDQTLFVELRPSDETVPAPIGLWLVEPEFDTLERSRATGSQGAPTAGGYTLRLQTYRCEASPKYLGWSYRLD